MATRLLSRDDLFRNELQPIPKQPKPDLSNEEDYTLDNPPQPTQQTVSAGGTIPGAYLPPNTSQSVEGIDNEWVQSNFQEWLKNREGQTFSEYFAQTNPEPEFTGRTEKDVQKRNKMALIADMIRLVTEGVGAFHGSDVQKRDHRLPYTYLEDKLLKDRLLYEKQYRDWAERGLQARLKDAQAEKDYLDRLTKSAPKIKQTVERKDGNWWIENEKLKKRAEEEAKRREFLGEEGDKNRESREKIATNANATRLQAARISASNRGSGRSGAPTLDRRLDYADGSGYVAYNSKNENNLMAQALDVMMNDPEFLKSTEARVIKTKYDYGDYGSNPSQVNTYVKKNIHKSPAARKYLEMAVDQEYGYDNRTLAPWLDDEEDDFWND